MSFDIFSRPRRLSVVDLLNTSGLPASDLTDAHMEHFYFCGTDAAPTALVGLEICGPDALLRSLVVSPDHRSRGLGRRLVAHAEDAARAMGVRAVYLLTTTAEPFFARLGYAHAEREAAPAGIRATKEFAGICPASSAFMVKRFAGTKASIL
jgi:amino-acid N-acetyltransferase